MVSIRLLLFSLVQFSSVESSSYHSISCCYVVVMCVCVLYISSNSLYKFRKSVTKVRNLFVVAIEGMSNQNWSLKTINERIWILVVLLSLSLYLALGCQHWSIQTLVFNLGFKIAHIIWRTKFNKCTYCLHWCCCSNVENFVEHGRRNVWWCVHSWIHLLDWWWKRPKPRSIRNDSSFWNSSGFVFVGVKNR